MQLSKLQTTICALTICLTSLPISYGAAIAGPIKQQKAITEKKKQEPETDANFESKIEDHPPAWSDAIPYYNLANKYLEKERFEDAVDNYHEAISRFPNDPDFYINLGYCYRKLEDFESAEQAFRKALTLNNKDWMTWSNLANALLKQNKLPETVSTFEKCLKLNMPASERAAINRDIVDIKKILAMRQPKTAAKPETFSGKGALTKPQALTKPTPNLPAKSIQAQPAAQARTKGPDKTEPTSSGWDYIK
jgi:tetratricopeptide (TPR) repeat protein